MSLKTKITLSGKELTLVKNADWILTKHTIIQKVYDLFAGNINIIKAGLLEKTFLPPDIRTSVPKIYKGENYLQLPYVMLDYPRCFEKQDIFAIRTMFWWANFFSITLHVSGKYKSRVKDQLLSDNFDRDENLYIGVNEDQWQHHFEENNYLPSRHFSKTQRQDLFEKNYFIKLALKFELDQWNEMPSLLEAGYKKITSMLA